MVLNRIGKKKPDVLLTAINFPIMRHSLFCRRKSKGGQRRSHTAKKGRKNYHEKFNYDCVCALCVCVSERSNKGSICISINQAAALALGPVWILECEVLCEYAHVCDAAAATYYIYKTGSVSSIFLLRGWSWTAECCCQQRGDGSNTAFMNFACWTCC